MGVALVSTILAGLGIEATSSVIQFPIHYVGSLWVDAQGRIYSCDITYERLQIYDKQGAFIRGWFTQGKHIVGVNLDEGTVHLVASDDRNWKYDLFGRPVDKWKEKGSYLETRSRQPKQGDLILVAYIDSYGNVWRYRPRFGGSHIVKSMPDGTEISVVKSPLYLWAIAFPFPAFTYMAVPAVIWAIGEARKKRRAKAHQRGSRESADQQDKDKDGASGEMNK